MATENQTRKDFSLELFPPKTTAGFEKLKVNVTKLNAVGPAYISVTYGAGGSTRERTFVTVGWLRQFQSQKRLLSLMGSL